jgi:hypothetical protein
MATFLPSLRLMRLWAVLVLAIIAVQAVIPAGTPLQHLQGSAFNATTVDVVVAPQRRDDTSESATAPQHDITLLSRAGPAITASTGFGSASSGDSALANGRADQRVRSWPPAPRAPPQA